MQTIAILSQKGGAGKTMLAVHIACAAQLDGFPSAILDMDQQGTAEAWHGWRGSTTHQLEPIVRAAKVSTLESWIDRASQAGGKIAVIDTPPLAQQEAMEAARLRT